jgi:hypothetical protein
MGTYKRLQREAMNWLNHLLNRPQPTPVVERIDPPDMGLSADGVDYSLPVIVPGYMRTAYADQPEKLREYIESASGAPYHDQFSSPYKTNTPFMPVTEDPLKEWAWNTRIRVLTSCHAAYDRNPLANAAVQYSADFIIGDGFNLACKNTEVSELLYAFIDDPMNAIREYERQAAIDLQVDGELFLRKFVGNATDGTQSQIRVIPMRPWECEYIRTEKGDFRTRLQYHFQLDSNYGDDPLQAGGTEPLNVPADEIIHVAINRHSYELRGRPDLYRILIWLRAYTDYLEERARQNKWRNALVWWAKVLNASASTIATISAAFARPPSPGTILTTSDRVEITPLNGGSGAGDMEDGRAIKNMAITGMRMAEYMFADGAQANLATATAQQLPALTRFEGYQRTLIEQLWIPLLKNVVQTAIDAGLIAEEVEEQDEEGEAIKEDPPIDEAPKMKTVTPGAPDGTNPGMQMPVPNVKDTPAKKLKAVDAFEITYEPVTDSDPKTLAEAYSLMMADGVASRKTYQSKLGLDPHYEDKQLRREAQQDMKMQAAGLKPIPPEMMRPEGMPSNMKQPPPGQEQGQKIA